MVEEKRKPGRPRIPRDEEGNKIRPGVDKTYRGQGNNPSSIMGTFSSGEEAGKRESKIDWLEQYYRLNDTTRSCIDAIALAASQSGHHFEPLMTGYELKENHKVILSRFFDNLNEEQDSADLFLETFLDMLTYGDAFWEIVIDYKGLVDFNEYIKNPISDPWDIEIPIQFHRVSGYTMRVKEDENGKILYYYQKGADGHEGPRWAPEKIIQFRVPSPIDDNQGLAPSATLKNTIASDIFANDYNAKFFANNATPRLHVDLGNASPEELKAFCGEAEKSLKGQPHKNIVTRGGVKIEPVGLKNSDMEFAKYQEWLTKKIMAMFKVQPIVLGYSSVSDRSTADQIALFKFLAVDPYRRIVSSRINKKVLQRFFPSVRVKLVFNPIDRLDLIAQSDVDVADVGVNIKTINEVREERGLPPVAWGDQQQMMPGQNPGPDSGKKKPNKKAEPNKDVQDKSKNQKGTDDGTAE